jgi:hypothetical protein
MCSHWLFFVRQPLNEPGSCPYGVLATGNTQGQRAMTLSQLNPDVAAPPEPFRWTRTEATHTLHEFQASHTSQRQFAQQAGLPRATLQYWHQQRQHPDLEPALVAFFESPSGYRFLRRLVLALHLVFNQAGHAGLRPLGQFLHLTQLDHFVAASYGVHQALASHLQDDLITFAAEERQRQGATMAPKTITACLDENFHGVQTCLVAIEPISNFLLVEAYHDHRDGRTWTTTIQQAVQGWPVEVIQITSDQAKGLLACAHEGFEAHHSPDIFHHQRELTQAVNLPLQRQTDAADKALVKAQQSTQEQRQRQQQYEQGPKPVGRPPDLAAALHWCEVWEARAASDVVACQTRQEQTQQAVRGLADDYHPFDQATGQPLTATEVEQRLRGHVATVAAVVTAAGLGERSQEALTRVGRWLTPLVATIAWFWSRARRLVEALALPEAAEQAVYQQLLPGLYWQQAAERGRDAEQKRQRRSLGQQLLTEAWSAASPLSQLREEERAALLRVAQTVQTLFCRSSSCVEGRNGRLSLYHHGQGALSPKRLQALTAVHNYVVADRDGITAAERFFGSKPREVFTWLLDRLPELPRPAKKTGKGAERAETVATGRPNP